MPSQVAAPRTLLFTGKGGVGKTTVAAATALHSARRGHKTLVLSTDAAHSLADAFAMPLGAQPTEIETGLYGLQVDPRAQLDLHWRHLQHHLLAALDDLGVDRVAAEELTVLPAAEEVLALLELRDRVGEGRWDVVVVDCAPTAETLRLLALPEALDGYLRRALPVGRRVARAVRAGSRGGADPVLASVNRLAAELGDVRGVLTHPATGVRLVLTPDSVVLAEARRTQTALGLFGYRVEAVVVNRLVPDGDDPWRAARAAGEREVLAAVAESFAPLPILVGPHTLTEPVGCPALAGVADDLYGPVGEPLRHDPLPVADQPPMTEVVAAGTGYELRLALPLAEKSQIDLSRRGDDLVVVVGAHRRVLGLPSGLRRCTVTGARLIEGVLRVEFEPDPDLWRP
jgi:arsenite-transporting ATPase